MATDDEIVRLILQIKGQDEARDLAKATADLRKQILDATLAHKSFDEAMKDPAIRKATADLHDMEAQFAKLEGVTRQAHNGLAGSGQAMIQWSRAIQDFQAAGFPGIVNNLELMAASIGAPAFIAGLATLAGVFGPSLIQRIMSAVFSVDELQEKLRMSVTNADALKARIEAIEKKPIKFAADYVELEDARAEVERLTRAANALNAALHRQTSTEQESGQAVAEGFAATAADRDVLNELQVRRPKAMVETSPEVQASRKKAAEAQARFAQVQKDIDEAEKRGAPDEELAGLVSRRQVAKKASEGATAERDALEKRIEKAARDQIGDLLDKAEKGTGKDQVDAQKELARIVDQLGSAAARSMARYLRSVSPEGIEASTMTPEEEKFFGQAEKSGKQAAAKQRKLDAFWEAEGKQADEMFAKQRRDQNQPNVGPQPAKPQAMPPGKGLPEELNPEKRVQGLQRQYEALLIMLQTQALSNEQIAVIQNQMQALIRQAEQERLRMMGMRRARMNRGRN